VVARERRPADERGDAFARGLDCGEGYVVSGHGESPQGQGPASQVAAEGLLALYGFKQRLEITF